MTTGPTVALPTDGARDRAALALLRDAFDVPVDERGAWLDARCGDDAVLRARVEALLQRVDEADARPVATPADVAGERLGPWRLLRRIGAGGMGEVFLAERADGAFAREVAIKRIRAGFAPLAERFLRERQILARLEHPGIAPLLDGGLDDDGRPWFALAYVRGEPITTWCDARRLGLEARVALLEKLCAAVQFAHANLVVHRDLKPANALVGEDGEPRLLDFGIAKLLDEGDAEQTQWLAMTPAYAAPEQRRGEAPTTATDVYQLGLLLRELLAGSLPARPPALDADWPRLAADFAERMRASPNEAEAIATARGLTAERLQAQLRGDLEHVVARATAGDAGARYPTAQALADDLARWRRREPVQARLHERGYRLRRALRRGWPWLAAAGLALAALGFHLQRMDAALERTQAERARAETERVRAEAARALAESEGDRARRVSEYLVELIQRASPREADDAEVTVRDLLEGSVDELLADETRPPLVRATLLTTAARALRRFGEHERTIAALERSIALQRAAPDANTDHLAYTLAELGTTFGNLDRRDEAARLTGEAAAVLDAHPSRDADLALGIRQKAASWAADPRQRRTQLAAVIEISHARLGPTPEQNTACKTHIGALNNLAFEDYDAGRLDEAEARVRRSLAALERCQLRDKAFRLLPQRSLVLVLLEQGRLDEARTLMDATVVDARAHWASGDPYVAQAEYTLGLVAQAQGDRDVARTQATRVAYPPGHPGTSSAELFAATVALADFDADGDAARLHDARSHLERAAKAAIGPALDPADTESQFRTLAAAYAACRATPSPATAAAFADAMAQATRLRQWMRAVAAPWSGRCTG
jgi:tetratricopeptide (TPR) repeat protein